MAIARLTLVLLLCCSTAYADPAKHLQSSSRVVTSGGSILELPPGYFVTEAAWAALDVEMKRLQTVETKLTAENAAIRATLSTWQPPWYIVASSFVIGMAGGMYLLHIL